MPINSRGGDLTAQGIDDVDADQANHSVAMLRGASVEVNATRVVQFVFALIALILVGLCVIFFVAGLHHNANVANLQRHGVSVSVTTTTCDGELGGSGSNLADFRCEGTFLLDGKRFHVTIPGHAFRPTGSRATFVTAKNDPGLLATPFELKREHASWRVFILPTVFLILLLLGVVLMTRRRLRHRTSVEPH